MSNQKIHLRKIVIKVGGSLLSQPNFVKRFGNWFAPLQEANPKTSFILIVGGGAPVEGLRQIDQANRLEESLCHWLAVKQMNLNGKLVDSLLEDWVLTKKLAPIVTASEPIKAIFVPHHFMLREEPKFPGTKLTVGWHITSDAIATRLAVCLNAELILLKSSNPPDSVNQENWSQLAEAGYIDSATPELIKEVAIRRVEKLPLA